MNRTRMVFSEAFRSLGANLSTTIAATMTVLIGMFLLGMLVALGSWVVSWSDQVRSELMVKVYFEQDRSDRHLNAVRTMLESDERVASVEFVSAAAALDRMQQRYPDLTQDLATNPFPDAFEVQPVDPDDTRAIAMSLEPPPPGVDKVRYGERTADRILQIARAIQAVFLVAVLVLLTASTLLIANTIRLSIFARRREIEVMKLVGATNWFVRGPFMLEGLLCGLIGAVAAVLLLLGKELALSAILGRIDAGAGIQAISFAWNAAILIAVSLVIGAIGSGLTLRRFLQV